MPYKILIVEDDPTIRTQLQILLSGAGYEAEAVTVFDRAAEQFRAYGPHLVLLDIKLPGAGGFAPCSQIRAVFEALTILLTSSNSDMDG